MERFYIHELEELTLLKCTYYPKTIYRFNAIPMKIPMLFSQKQKKSYQICMEPQKTSNSQSNPKENKKQSQRYYIS